jgi:ABC-type uncharacterized transport system permease subunit
MNHSISFAPRLPSGAALLPLAAVAAALLLGIGLVALTGAPVGEALAAFADGAVGSPYAIAASVNRALVLALVGTGFVLADRAKLTNVGGEGQIAVGGMAATAVSLYGGVAGLPFGLAFLIPLCAAALAGACWGGIAGLLKAKAGTNEVISTLMLSFIGVWLLYWSVQSETLLRQPMSNSGTLPESRAIPLASHLPFFFGDEAMPLHLGLPLTVLLGVVVATVLASTLFGIHLRAVGLNPVAARRAGMPITCTVVLAMMLAGALGGLGGGVMLQGEQYALKSGFSSGYGFDGLVVGLLARGSIGAVFAGALLFGFLRSGGINMEMVASVPSALVLVVQGVIILTVAGSTFSQRHGAHQ